jgi:hypothetical protein
VALPRYPILIGISANRIFDKADAKADGPIAQALAARLRKEAAERVV